jgi:hypothetical protein
MRLKSEVEALALVEKIGRPRALKISHSISNRLTRRVNNANASVFSGYFTLGCIKEYDWEKELSYKLKLGLMMTDFENTPEAARERNIKRREDRKAMRSKEKEGMFQFL